MNNDSLTDIDGMVTLSSIGGEFKIQSNTILANLEIGLASLVSIKGAYTVTDNPKLPTVQATNVSNRISGVVGTPVISGNQP